MSTLFYERNLAPFDLLFKDFFRSELNFAPATEAKIPHPIDVYENPEGIHFEVACTGLTKEDVEINIEGDLLNIRYNKDNDSKNLPSEDTRYIHKGIARRSFSLGYKLATKFNLSQATAEMENGLLKISVPFAEESKPKVLKIK